MAISSNDGSPDDVFIRYLGADETRGEEPQGALVAVVPREEGREAWVADVVQGFAELAELCLIHAHRLDDLERDSDADALTGCLTRRAIERSLAAELARSHRSNVPFTIGFLDIDGFCFSCFPRKACFGTCLLGSNCAPTCFPRFFVA